MLSCFSKGQATNLNIWQFTHHWLTPQKDINSFRYFLPQTDTSNTTETHMHCIVMQIMILNVFSLIGVCILCLMSKHRLLHMCFNCIWCPQGEDVPEWVYALLWPVTRVVDLWTKSSILKRTSALTWTGTWTTPTPGITTGCNAGWRGAPSKPAGKPGQYLDSHLIKQSYSFHAWKW